jgi:hypothetical protein
MLSDKHANLRLALTIVLGCLAVAGWALHWHLTINNAPQPAARQDGYLSVAQCTAIPAGQTESSLVAEYGMPHGDDGYSNGSTDMWLSYPLTEDHSKNCTVDFGLVSYKVYKVALDLLNEPDN